MRLVSLDRNKSTENLNKNKILINTIEKNKYIENLNKNKILNNTRSYVKSSLDKIENEEDS